MAKNKTMDQQLEEAKTRLETMERFLERVQSFSDVMADAKSRLADMMMEEQSAEQELRAIRGKIRDLKEEISAASDGMLKILEPGPVKFMPLFDRMEKASTQKHGQNASKWREQPLSVLRLSPSSTTILYDAEILFVGQLQDRVLADPESWWFEVDGLSEAVVAAIVDKLNDFVARGGDV